MGHTDCLDKPGLGGISRRATVYKEILANTSGNAIFVDGGNALCIDPSYSLFRGQIETFFMQMFNFTGRANCVRVPYKHLTAQ